MRYWCEICETEFNFNEKFRKYEIRKKCPCCKAGSRLFHKLPDYETPKQYERRTGKKWRGLAWLKYPKEAKEWNCVIFNEKQESVMDDRILFLCAASPEPPEESC